MQQRYVTASSVQDMIICRYNEYGSHDWYDDTNIADIKMTTGRVSNPHNKR